MYALLAERQEVMLKEVRGSADFSVLEPVERRYFSRFLNPMMKCSEGDVEAGIS